MEIRDFVRANRRRLPMLAVLPLVAAGVVVAVLWGQPQQHRATVEVVVMPGGNDPLSPNVIGQYVANFGEAVHTKTVKDAVIASTGVERTELNEVDTRQIGRSNVIEVSYVGSPRALAKEVVVASARETVLVLAQPQLDSLAAARERHAEASAARDAAIAALDAFTAETGLVLPEEEFQSRAAQLRALQDNRQEALGAGGSVAASALANVIAARQAELDALAEEVLRFQQLELGLETSTEDLRVAATDLRAAELLAERASVSLDLSEAEATAVSRVGRMVEGAAVAGGLALVIGMATMALAEALRNRRLEAPATGSAGRTGGRPPAAPPARPAEPSRTRELAGTQEPSRAREHSPVAPPSPAVPPSRARKPSPVAPPSRVAPPSPVAQPSRVAEPAVKPRPSPASRSFRPAASTPAGPARAGSDTSAGGRGTGQADRAAPSPASAVGRHLADAVAALASAEVNGGSDRRPLEPAPARPPARSPRTPAPSPGPDLATLNVAIGAVLGGPRPAEDRSRRPSQGPGVPPAPANGAPSRRGADASR